MGVKPCPRCKRGTLVFCVGIAAMPLPAVLPPDGGQLKVPVVECLIATCTRYDEGCNFRVAGRLSEGAVVDDDGAVTSGGFVPEPRLTPFRPGWSWTLLRHLEQRMQEGT